MLCNLNCFKAGSANTGQQRNVQYANALYYLQTQVHRILGNMKSSIPESGISIIVESLQALDNLAAAIIQPLLGIIYCQICVNILNLTFFGCSFNKLSNRDHNSDASH